MEQINDHLGIIIQTSGIFIALLFVVSSYRLSTIKKLLVGQGAAVLDSANEGRTNELIGEYAHLIPYFPRYRKSLNSNGGGKKIAYWTYVKRLSNSIKLEEMYGVEEILIRYTKAELNYCIRNNVDLDDRGFSKGVLPRFIRTKNHHKMLKFFTIFLYGIFSLSILFSLFISGWESDFFFWNKLALFIGVLLASIFIFIAFLKSVGQEKEKKKDVKGLIKSDAEIEKIYKVI